MRTPRILSLLQSACALLSLSILSPIAAEQPAARGWPSGQGGTFIPGDELRVVYLFQKRHVTSDLTARMGDVIRLQAVFAPSIVDLEKLSKDAPPRPLDTVIRPGDELAMAFGFDSTTKPSDALIGPNDRVSVKFQIRPEIVDAVTLDAITRSMDQMGKEDEFIIPKLDMVKMGDAAIMPGSWLTVFVTFDPSPRPSDHRAQISETIEAKFEFNGRYDFSKEIDSKGMLSIPLVGRIKVAGLTSEEIEQLIVTRIEPMLGNEMLHVEILHSGSRYMPILSQYGISGTGGIGGGGIHRAVIRPDGQVFLPPFGWVSTTGHTVTSFETMVAEKLQSEGLLDLKLNFVINADDSLRLDGSVFGEVRQKPDVQGRIMFPIIGAKKIVGLSASQLEGKLEEVYAALIGPVKLTVIAEPDRESYLAFMGQVDANASGGTYQARTLLDGSIFLPPIGYIDVGGRKLADIEAELRKMIDDLGYPALTFRLALKRASTYTLDPVDVMRAVNTKITGSGDLLLPMGLELNPVGKSAKEIENLLIDYYRPLIQGIMIFRVRIDPGLTPSAEELRETLRLERSFATRVTTEGMASLPGLPPQKFTGETPDSIATKLKDKYELAGFGQLDVVIAPPTSGIAVNIGPEQAIEPGAEPTPPPSESNGE